MTVIEAVPTTTAPERRRLMGDAYDLSGATNADEARKAAGLEWEAVHRPLLVDLGDIIDDDDPVAVERERAVVRDDTGEMFGVVGREHKLLSNAEFFGFADALLTEADLTWATSEPFGGARGNGKSPFLAFQLTEGIEVAGMDAVGCGVLLNNGHVGNAAATLNVTPIRNRCSNVVTPILRGRLQNLFTYTIQHSGDIAEKMAKAREALSLTTVAMREMAVLADRMAAIDLDMAAFDDLVADLVPIADEAGERAKATAETQRAAFRRNWRDTLTLDADLKATAWGALNVITEVIDHGNLEVRKSSVPPAERRLQFVHHGTGARLRDRAYTLLGV